jgi:hypothetical protein
MPPAQRIHFLKMCSTYFSQKEDIINDTHRLKLSSGNRWGRDRKKERNKDTDLWESLETGKTKVKPNHQRFIGSI